MNESVIVPHGSYSNTIQVKEWTPLEPDTLEYNYYAPGVGLVLKIDPESGERVELVDISVQFNNNLSAVLNLRSVSSRT